MRAASEANLALQLKAAMPSQVMCDRPKGQAMRDARAAE